MQSPTWTLRSTIGQSTVLLPRCKPSCPTGRRYVNLQESASAARKLTNSRRNSSQQRQTAWIPGFVWTFYSAATKCSLFSIKQRNVTKTASFYHITRSTLHGRVCKCPGLSCHPLHTHIGASGMLQHKIQKIMMLMIGTSFR